MRTVFDSDTGEIDDVEKTLREELSSVDLIGEIDLDSWASIVEEALRSKVRHNDPDRLRRLWPATLATYLVCQGVNAYEDATFWPNVSIEELRNGTVIGPEFEKALEALGLPTFDDIEEIEGIGKHTRGRYLRRIHLHGGIPRNSVEKVIDLLASTLRSGATSASDVIDLWSGYDLSKMLHSRPAARCLLYTGGLAERLVGQLIELIRVANRQGDLGEVGAPSHLEEGIHAYIDRPHDRIDWQFVAGPSLRVDPHRGQPYLQVPRAADCVWSVNGNEIGISSRQVEERFELPLPENGWTVTSSDVDGEQTRRYTPERTITTVVVFDGRGRFHRRGTPLGGIRAHVVAEPGTNCSGTIESRSLEGIWGGFELITVDLRLDAELVITTVEGPEVRIPVENEVVPRISRGRVDGLSSNGKPVLTGQVTLVFDGYTPYPEDVEIRTPHRSTKLNELERIYGEFDITPCFDPHVARDVDVVIQHVGLAPITFEVAYVPGVELDRPRLSPPRSTVSVGLKITERNQTHTFNTEVPAEASSEEVEGDLAGGVRRFTIELNRLGWTVDGPHTVIPLLDEELFSIRLSELHSHQLMMSTGGVPVRVALLDGPAPHEEWAHHDRKTGTVRISQVRAFGDTARASSGAHNKLAVLCDDEPPIVVGYIESRYQPTSLIAEVGEEDSGTPILDVLWEELTEWADREVRLWSRTTPQTPALIQRIEPGMCSARIPIAELNFGMYVVEVGASDGWNQPRFPDLGSGATHIYIGSEDATRLSDAIERGDRREKFSNDQLDAMVPLLADLLIQLVNADAPRDQKVALLERVADEQWRAIEVIGELHDRMGADDDLRSSRLLERHLFGLLPMLWVNPIYDRHSDVSDEQLDRLWEIAPLAAACLDHVRDTAGQVDADCNDRWIRAVGFTIARPSNLINALDKLVSWESDKDLRWDPVELLTREAWIASVKEMASVDRSSPSWRELESYQGVAWAIEQRCEQQRRTGWSGIPARVARKLRSINDRDGWLPDLVRLSCELLEPTSQDSEADVVEALRAAHAACPQATRTAFIYSATALRLRQAAGLAGGLVS